MGTPTSPPRLLLSLSSRKKEKKSSRNGNTSRPATGREEVRVSEKQAPGNIWEVGGPESCYGQTAVRQGPWPLSRNRRYRTHMAPSKA